jgi:hypothetical protein
MAPVDKSDGSEHVRLGYLIQILILHVVMVRHMCLVGQVLLLLRVSEPCIVFITMFFILGADCIITYFTPVILDWLQMKSKY